MRTVFIARMLGAGRRWSAAARGRLLAMELLVELLDAALRLVAHPGPALPVAVPVAAMTPSAEGRPQQAEDQEEEEQREQEAEEAEPEVVGVAVVRDRRAGGRHGHADVLLDADLVADEADDQGQHDDCEKSCGVHFRSPRPSDSVRSDGFCPQPRAPVGRRCEWTWQVPCISSLAAMEMRQTGPRAPQSDQFRLLVDTVRDYAIFLLSPDGLVMSWNAGAERIKGYAASEIIGKHFSTFYQPADARSGKPDDELRIATSEGRYEEEGWRVRKDGSLFWASVVITALRDERGEIVGFAKVTRDLSERKTAEEQRTALLDRERQARLEAEQALQ